MAGRRLPEKLYRISEVMDHTGLSRQTVHFYTTLGLIAEKSRTPAGYRLYPPSVFGTLEKVRSLQNKGYTLGQIRESLSLKTATRLPAATHARIAHRKTKDDGGSRKRPSN